MNCLIDFLTDEKQKSLINMVQNREETFEDELDSYMKLFLVEMEHHISSSDSCRHESCLFPDICSNIKTVIKDIQQEEPEKIQLFFKGINYCYSSWIDSKTTIALETFDNLLKNYNLISDGAYNKDDKLLIHNITERVFFRGRITDQFLGKMDMFHVPYNKRYSLRNERFSLTGQPVLYLGNSVADIVEELELDINSKESMKHLKISSFEFRESKIKKKIFDLRCNIWEDIKKNTFTEEKFYRNILSIICSFQKRKGLEEYTFKEEYVIPQMLSQVLKQNHYDGICYYSTKPFSNYTLDKDDSKIIEEERKMFFRENLAVFTKKEKKSDQNNSLPFYDKDLLDSLEISMPIGIRNTKKNLHKELYHVHQSIKETVNNSYLTTEQNNDIFDKQSYNNKDKNDKNFQKQKKADSIIDFYNLEFAKLKIDGHDYINTEIGQIHLQLLVGILNRILVESEVDNKNNITPTNTVNENLPNESIQCCDLFGIDTKKLNSKTVYDEGILHKENIIFLTRKIEGDSEIKIALSQNKWNTLFYGTNEYVEKQLNNHEILSIIDKKHIGSFIHYDFSIIEWPKIGTSLKKNFKYIEIFLSDISSYDDNIKEVTWYSYQELISALIEQYPKFSSIYQQALPILINYLNSAEQ